MTYPPPGQGYPGGPPQNPYGQQPDPYGSPQYQSPDPYAQQPDPYAQQPDPYAQQPDPYAQQQPPQQQFPPADNGWGSPPQPAPGGYPDHQQYAPMSGIPMTGPPLSGPPMSPAPQMGPYNPMGMPQQAPKKNNAPLVVGLVLGVVALLGLGAVLVVTLGGDKDDPPIAEQSKSATPSEEASTTPPEDQRLSYSEFGTDWTGSYGGANLTASFLYGWDYDTCSDVEVGGALTDAGCEYAFEVVYEAEGGDLRMAQMFLAMSDSSTASSMGSSLNDDEFEADYRFSSDSTLASYEEGLWMSDSGGDFIVLTITTRATGELDTTYLENYLYGKSDDTVLALEGR